MLAIRLPKEIELRLDNLAKATGRTKTFYTREAILAYMEDMEDLYLADKSMRALKSGKVKAIPLDQVERNLGLAD
jgi:RHH-type rel operon transcriptional repressor/antitoxin RelB